MAINKTLLINQVRINKRKKFNKNLSSLKKLKKIINKKKIKKNGEKIVVVAKKIVNNNKVIKQIINPKKT